MYATVTYAPRRWFFEAREGDRLVELDDGERSCEWDDGGALAFIATVGGFGSQGYRGLQP